MERRRIVCTISKIKSKAFTKKYVGKFLVFFCCFQGRTGTRERNRIYHFRNEAKYVLCWPKTACRCKKQRCDPTLIHGYYTCRQRGRRRRRKITITTHARWLRTCVSHPLIHFFGKQNECVDTFFILSVCYLCSCHFALIIVAVILWPVDMPAAHGIYRQCVCVAVKSNDETKKMKKQNGKTMWKREKAGKNLQIEWIIAGLCSCNSFSRFFLFSLSIFTIFDMIILVGALRND